MSDKNFADADEWFTTSPRICLKCYALVPWQYEEQHLEWHHEQENQK